MIEQQDRYILEQSESGIPTREVQQEISGWKAEIERLQNSNDFRERKNAELMRMDMYALGDDRTNFTAVWFPAGPLSDRGPLIDTAAEMVKDKVTPQIIINGGTVGQGFGWIESVHGYNREKVLDETERNKAFVWAGTTEWAKMLDEKPWIDLSKNVAWTDRPGINNPEEHKALLEWLERHADTAPLQLGNPIRMGVLCWPHQLPRQLLGLLKLVNESPLKDKLSIYPVVVKVPDWNKQVNTNQNSVETRLDNVLQEQQRLVNYRYKPEPDMAPVSDYEEYLRRRDGDPLSPQKIQNQFWKKFASDPDFREAATYMLSAAKQVNLSKLPENWD